MADPRTTYFRRLRRLRRSARRWSVLATTLAGATAVLLPYHGIGLPDVFWAAGAGGSAALAWWRWQDARAQAALPAPPEPPPVLPADRTRHVIEAVLAGIPGGRTAVDEMRRAQGRARLRGLAVAPGWARLDRAAQTLAGLSGRLGPGAEPALQEAADAERSLREIAVRAADVERALRLAPDDARAPLAEAHTAMLTQFGTGVDAYERVVAAAAGYVAEDGRMHADAASVARLSDAADLLQGIATGLSELRTVNGWPQPPLSTPM